jgi:hypothetical protein
MWLSLLPKSLEEFISPYVERWFESQMDVTFCVQHEKQRIRAINKNNFLMRVRTANFKSEIKLIWFD